MLPRSRPPATGGWQIGSSPLDDVQAIFESRLNDDLTAVMVRGPGALTWPRRPAPRNEREQFAGIEGRVDATARS